MFRRPIRRAMIRRAVRPIVRPPLPPLMIDAMARANRLQQSGQPAAAGPIFAQLALEMERSNHPKRAANLHAQAAHSFADSLQEQPSLLHARAALNLFIVNQMVDRTPRFFANITRKLEARGLPGASEALKKEFGNKVGPLPAETSPDEKLNMAETAPAQRGRLPARCSQCGAPIRSDEVEWVDDFSAECTYCGALLQTD